MAGELLTYPICASPTPIGDNAAVLAAGVIGERQRHQRNATRKDHMGGMRIGQHVELRRHRPIAELATGAPHHDDPFDPVGNLRLHTSLRSSGTTIVAIPFEPKIEVSYFAIRPSGGQRIGVLDDIVKRMGELMALPQL